ncbi:MAG: DUF456 domain-containing protein [Acidobacteriota bacterium]|jgi:uncharacterized protein YqgC (DUF456 family)
MTVIVAVLLWMLAVALVVTGVIGLVLPGLPGAPLVFGGLLVAAWLEGFAYVGAWTLLLLALLAVLTQVVDIFAGALGARHFGASRSAVVGAILGAVVGVFFGLPGVVLGPFFGALIGELLAERPLREAGAAGFGAGLGLLIGVALKLALAFSMIGIFVIVRLWGAFG